MAINKIVKYHLEEQAYNLKQAGKSYRDIAETLSGTSGTRITPNTVQRFFDTHENLRDELVQDIIDRQDTIIATSISQTLDVNAFRIRLTSSLMTLLEDKLKEVGYKDGKEIAALSKEIREGLNDMDPIIQSIAPTGSMDYNLGETLTDDQLLAALKLTDCP
jgi:hypothetical protein